MRRTGSGQQDRQPLPGAMPFGLAMETLTTPGRWKQEGPSNVYPLVLMMVMVPAPSVCILVHATTDFPERPAPGGVGGLFSSTESGLSVGVGGGLSNSLLISLNVTSP